MKVALLTMDNREPDKDYSAAAPRFGTAPTALLSGFASLPGVEVHVVSRVQKPLHIAAAMIRVAQDWELCQRMGEAAYKKVRCETPGRIMAIVCWRNMPNA